MKSPNLGPEPDIENFVPHEIRVSTADHEGRLFFFLTIVGDKGRQLRIPIDELAAQCLVDTMLSNLEQHYKNQTRTP